MNTTFLSIALIFLPLIGAGVGYLIKQSIEKKKELLSEVNKERRESYQKFIDLIIELFKNAKTKDYVDPKFMSKLYDFYKKYILFASPRVINAFSDYFQYLYQTNSGLKKLSNKKQIRLLTKAMAEMRRDLGLKNNKLGIDGERLLRVMITDFDKVMK